MRSIFYLPLVSLFTLFSITRASAQFRLLNRDTDAGNTVKKFSFYSNKEGFIAFSKYIGYTADSGHTVVAKPITGSNVNYNGFTVSNTVEFFINGVHAFDKDELLVYGHYAEIPAILHSADAGNTFKLLVYNTARPGHSYGFTSMVFVSRTNGFAIDKDVVWRTNDGGHSWKYLFSGVDMYMSDIQAFPLNNNYYYTWSTETGHYIFGTGDDYIGNPDFPAPNYMPLPIPNGDRINSAFFLSYEKGWINISRNNNGSTWYTSDAGSSWTRISDSIATPFLASDMHFINDNTGYATSRDNRLYKTTDSGRVWEPLLYAEGDELSMPELNTFFVGSDNVIWLGGKTNSAIAITGNAGGVTIPLAKQLIDTSGYRHTGIIRLVNHSRRTYQYKWFVNGQLISTDYNASYQRNTLLDADTIKLVVDNGSRTDTLLRYQQYNPCSGQGSGPQIMPVVTVNGKTTVKTGEATLLTINIQNPGISGKIHWEDSTAARSWQPIGASEDQSQMNYTPAAAEVKLRVIYTSTIFCVGETTVKSAAVPIHINDVTGINPIPGSNLGIKYYPNPVKDILNVESLELSDKWESLTVFDISGKKKMEMSVKNLKRTSLPLTALPAGVYVAILMKKSGVKAYFKFIKQ